MHTQPLESSCYYYLTQDVCTAIIFMHTSSLTLMYVTCFSGRAGQHPTPFVLTRLLLLQLLLCQPTEMPGVTGGHTNKLPRSNTPRCTTTTNQPTNNHTERCVIRRIITTKRAPWMLHIHMKAPKYAHGFIAGRACSAQELYGCLD